jgi:4-amino-4-deoxy-L-arabinose transferase-like glycosyltransferase
MSEAILVPLELAALAAALMARRVESGRWWWLAVAGLCSGLGILARPSCFPVLIGVALLAILPGRPWRAWLPGVAVVVGVGLLTVVPWVARDQSTFHSLVPITDIDGFNLAGVYNSQAASNGYPAHYQWRPPTAVPSLLPLFANPRLTEVGLGDSLRHAGLTYISHHPTSVISASFWDTWRMFELSGLKLSTEVAVEAGYTKRIALLGMLGFWLVALLAAIGVLARKARQAPLALWLTPLLLLVVTVPFLGNARLRAPIDPFFILAAALAVVTLVDRFARVAIAARPEPVPEEERPLAVA